ncbi:hypothetical protein VIN7_6618 [Saccharomyces cerevisiae x Saccharomyces kudriavzevii VIN7]|uniref:Uncharacterized protein n=1 Tax=Saccharomyces cerevisiae x Saccharomyces kudriavzevii (strain VIN7) TaxID=1095631 RepID=H0GTN1_SACCK|nr:hypothetical protein VIN7_6618 [Saccharomyces cerevisiae x Saccharomyces kudriavzevii VIN7]
MRCGQTSSAMEGKVEVRVSSDLKQCSWSSAGSSDWRKKKISQVNPSSLSLCFSCPFSCSVLNGSRYSHFLSPTLLYSLYPFIVFPLPAFSHGGKNVEYGIMKT